jgi:hypothetical protein
MPKIENIIRAITLINLVIPNVASVVVMLKNGKKIDLGALLEDTDKRINEIITKGDEFLKK